MNGNMIPNGYVQVVAPNFDGSFIDRIVREGVDAYKAQERRFPIERERSLVYDKAKGILVVQFAVEGEVRKVAEFCRGYIANVVKVVYNPKFDFEDCYLIDLVLEKEWKAVIVPESSWGKKEMLQILRNHGLVFTLARKENEILQILNNYLAVFLREDIKTKFDPRAGWHNKEGWEYRTADTFPMTEIPSIVRDKSLGIQGSVEGNELQETIEWLTGIRNGPIRLLMLTVLCYGTSCSRIFELTKICQGKYILFSCKSERVRYFIRKFFGFFINDSECRVSLSMPTKELIRILKESKDQTIVVDVDTADISGRRKPNTELLRAFISQGSLPGGETAESLVIFITKGIPEGIDFDDAFVFEICEDDIDLNFLEMQDIRLQSALLVSFFVDNIKRNGYWFERKFTGLETMSSMTNVLRVIGDIIIELMKEYRIFRDLVNTRQEYANMLRAAEEFADVVGIGGIVSGILISKIQRGKVRLKSVDQEIGKSELSEIILYDRTAFYLSDEIFRQVILPDISSSGITPIILRKYLAREGFLQKYSSESGEKSYKKRKFIKTREGNYDSVWLTAILRKRIEEATQIELDDLVEVMNE